MVCLDVWPLAFLLLAIFPDISAARPSPVAIAEPDPDPSPTPTPSSTVQCPIIFDGRVRLNASLSDFDSPSLSPYSTQYVKGENLSWSSILLFPSNSYPSSRFSPQEHYRPIEVTIDDHSLFRSGSGLQTGFRRAGLLLKDDKNDAGADPADKGKVTFHWSVEQDLAKMLNYTHEYMNVWHERADYNGNQWSFTAGLILPVDGGDGVDTKEKRESFKVQDQKNKIIYEVPILWRGWQNFAVQLDYDKNTIQVFYSVGDSKLEAVTDVLSNDNSGGGQMQIGIAKKPTETKTVVWDGYQEPLKRHEGQSYSSLFVEDSSDDCISL